MMLDRVSLLLAAKRAPLSSVPSHLEHSSFASFPRMELHYDAKNMSQRRRHGAGGTEQQAQSSRHGAAGGTKQEARSRKHTDALDTEHAATKSSSTLRIAYPGSKSNRKPMAKHRSSPLPLPHHAPQL